MAVWIQAKVACTIKRWLELPPPHDVSASNRHDAAILHRVLCLAKQGTSKTKTHIAPEVLVGTSSFAFP